MTDIQIEKQGDRWRFSAQGHATGSVEACAAVSVLLTALDAYLQYGSEELGTRVYRREVGSGTVRLHFSGGAETRGAAEVVELGLLLLQKSYGEYISVEVREL